MSEMESIQDIFDELAARGEIAPYGDFKVMGITEVGFTARAKSGKRYDVKILHKEDSVNRDLVWKLEETKK